MGFLKFIFLFLYAAPSYAFVENVTHGYFSCLACHVSPSGGGLLNDYGRSLSKELMSTWGWEGSERPLFGAVENTERLKFGGDLRILQSYLENSKIRQGRRFTMQQNVELGLNHDKLWAVGTAGSFEGDFISERHYLLWETSEESRLRVGKFRVAYGIYDPNHTRVTKAPLGFGPNSETYNLEFTKFTEADELILTAGLGRLDKPHDETSERTLIATYSRFLGSTGKAGVSAMVADGLNERRSLLGVFAVFPPLERTVLKIELDYQRATRELVAGHLMGGYELFKGVLPYFFFEYLDPDLAHGRSKQSAPGLGLQWLPLPHIELQAEYRKQILESAPGEPNDIAWIIFHFYL